MNRNRIYSIVGIALSALGANAQLALHFPMELRSGQVVEQISGQRFGVKGHFAPESVTGVTGQAVRFDGYTSRVEAKIGNIIPQGTTKMTVSAWVAVPCYPIIQVDTDTSEQTAILSCVDDSAKQGFGFYIGFDGKYSFKCYVSGWAIDLKATNPITVGKWHNLTAVLDCEARTAKLYDNGVEVASGKCSGGIKYDGGTLYMGQNTASRMFGPFELMSYNGLIDEVKVWTEAISADEIKTWTASATPDLHIPASRFAEDIMRPRFHGMPEAAWTNETHGLCYSGGRYHLFFQKNANGPYMSRLHWGHLTSENLYDWREEPIAIAPGDPYDIKGCWSGCVFTDDVITAGRPNIIYTGVDYGHASMIHATPNGTSLATWTKKGEIIPGRPAGLTDDFRDPYFFRNGSNAYIIVGSSKNGVGVTTLHKYDAGSKTWSNDGTLFHSGVNERSEGSFWEMPNVTPMGNGKWLFTATPLGSLTGVHTMYWTGSINANGQFVRDDKSASPRSVELISRDGFGLLSPTIYQHEGKTIALGIVPDRLSGESNWNMGWAHCYSLPREWSLDADGNLQQRPYSGLAGLRSEVKFDKQNFVLSGTQSLAPVAGRAVELCATFAVGDGAVGFNIFKNADGHGSITYKPRSGELVIDFSKVYRVINDNGVYNGKYSCFLPEFIKKGEDFKINVFIDHSILDIFINDRWATSLRVFPTAADATGIEAFADSPTDVKSLQAWVLGSGAGAAVDAVEEDSSTSPVNAYSIDGRLLLQNTTVSQALDTLQPGLYIIGGRKYLIK